jgi:hypothetical protein
MSVASSKAVAVVTGPSETSGRPESSRDHRSALKGGGIQAGWEGDVAPAATRTCFPRSKSARFGDGARGYLTVPDMGFPFLVFDALGGLQSQGRAPYRGVRVGEERTMRRNEKTSSRGHHTGVPADVNAAARSTLRDRHWCRKNLVYDHWVTFVSWLKPLLELDDDITTVGHPVEPRFSLAPAKRVGCAGASARMRIARNADTWSCLPHRRLRPAASRSAAARVASALST